jgi:hypothetical protein
MIIKQLSQLKYFCTLNFLYYTLNFFSIFKRFLSKAQERIKSFQFFLFHIKRVKEKSQMVWKMIYNLSLRTENMFEKTFFYYISLDFLAEIVKMMSRGSKQKKTWNGGNSIFFKEMEFFGLICVFFVNFNFGWLIIFYFLWHIFTDWRLKCNNEKICSSNGWNYSNYILHTLQPQKQK